MRILSIVIILMLVLAPAAYADNVTKRQVWVDPRIEDYSYVHDMIANALDPGDGITVNVEYSGPAYVKPNTTHVIAFDNGMDLDVSVYAGTDWPDQKTAVEILSRSYNNIPYQPVTRILRFIRDVHQWQQEHPR